ncbi:MAG: hypothetical protein J6D87_04000 [Clostridia bacterium]|nr:hypothetical protein [Clostridia bacterium]
MKRIIAILLAILTVTAVFASCSRREQFRPTDTDAPTGEQTTVAGQTDGNDPNDTNPADTSQDSGDVTTTTPPDIPIGDPSTGDAENGKITGNPYEGWTKEELYASFLKEEERAVYNKALYHFDNTPYYVILDVQYGGYMFSKLTGQVMQICKDPICDHEDCIFGNHTTQLLSCQVVDDRIYIVVDGVKEGGNINYMYSFDLLMDDPKLVCEWTDSPQNIYIYKDKVYYITELKMDNGQYGYDTMVYDMKEKNTSPLREKTIPCIASWHEGTYVWYTPREDGSLRRYNLDTGEDEVILAGSLLNREEGETGFCFLGASDQAVYVKKWRAGGGLTNCLRYDVETGQMEDMGAKSVLIYDDNIYFGVSHNVDTYKDDPHYKYYFNNIYAGTALGGKIFLRNERTEEQHAIVNLLTDQIPDCIKGFLCLDEKFMIIEYQTYKDFTNYYSPSIPEWGESKRYVVVNLETGIAYELGVDLSTQSVHKQ